MFITAHCCHMHSTSIARSWVIYLVLYGAIMAVIVMTALYVDTGSMSGGIISPDIVSIVFWGTVYGCLMVISYRASDRSSTLTKRLSDICAVTGMAAFAITIVSTNLIAALLVVIKWTLAAMILTLPGVRPTYFILAAAVTLVITAASQAKSTGFLFFIILFSLLAMGLLMLMYRRRLVEQNTVVSGSAEDVESIRPMLAPVAGVMLPVLAIASTLYFLVPRPDAFNFGRSLSAKGELYQDSEWEEQAEQETKPQTQEQQTPEPSGEGKTASRSGIRSGESSDIPSDYPRYEEGEMRYGGFSESFDVSQTANQTSANGNPIVLYVRSDQPIYLKARIFDQFDGARWRSTLKLGKKQLLDNGELVLSESEQGFVSEQTVEVEVETNMSDEVPLADRTSTLRFPATVLSVDPRGLIRAPGELKRGTAYSFLHQPEHYQRRPTSQPLEPPLLPPNQQLPESFDPAIRSLALSVTRGSASAFDRALAIEQHLQTQYQYSLDSAFNSQNYTPLSDFLFNTKSGHCEYFASAMAIMLRSIDIPARLVTGFSVHHYNPLTGLYEVRALHGHAWVEAWLQDVGWVSFQPTPGYPMPLEPEQSENEETTGEELNQYLEQLSQLEQVLAPEDIPSLILTRLHEIMKQMSQISTRVVRELTNLVRGNLWVIVAFMVFASIFYAGYRFFRHDLIRYWVKTRFNRLENADEETFWPASYRLLDRWFECHGFPREPWMTIEEYTSRLPVAPDMRGALERDYLENANQYFYGTGRKKDPTRVESNKATAFKVLKQIFQQQDN